MKDLRYILILLTFCMAAISCKREDGPRYPAEGTGRPIVFTAVTEWPEMTKAVINTTDDIKDVGFRIWGNWRQDVDGKDKHAVFGTSGTDVSFRNNSWTCSDEQSWYKGYYGFAAMLPASQFTGTYTGNKLVLDPGDSGLDLAATQTDLMYAFCNVDNTEGDASTVDLVFNHAFSLLDIRLKRNGAFVTNVMLYGIHRKTTGPLEYSHASSIGEAGEITSNMDEILSDVTTEDSPYYIKTYPTGSGFNYSNNEISLLKGSGISGPLLVFPEDLTLTPLKIVIGLSVNGQAKEIRTEVNTGEWTPGATYAYVLEYNNN